MKKLWILLALCTLGGRLTAQPAVMGQVVATHVFNGPGESPDPQFGLLELAGGGFIGITQGTGSNAAASRMIYTMTPAGAVTVMASFANGSSDLGYHLYEGSGTYQLIQASDGNFYGVSNGQLPDLGNVFRITPAGAYSVVYSFNSNPGGASAAQGGLAEGLDGNLYGFGGGSSPGGWGIYTINLSSGQFGWAYYDTSGDFVPVGTPVFSAGNELFGLASVSPPSEQPALFSFDIATLAFTTQAMLSSAQSYSRSFSDPIVIAPDGSIWFTSIQTNYAQPGCPPDCSNIIEIAAGQAQVIYSFPGRPAVNAAVSLILASDGKWYGDTFNPTGKPSTDSVFQYVAGAAPALYPSPQNAGTDPSGPLTQDANGYLRGTHAAGATSANSGAAFFLNVGLARPLPAIRGFAPASGPAGTMVKVLGSHFVNVTAMTLNGVAVKFKEIGSGVVTFAVPRGATTGTIGITTAAGTGTSGSVFQVE